MPPLKKTLWQSLDVISMWGLFTAYIEAGWFVAEYGRQPWAIGEILPVTVAASSQPIENLIISLIVILSLYTVFILIESYLMITVARKGPSSLKTGRYHDEQASLANTLTRQVQE
ncbi:MAG: cytochrome ubiquinol oxidase subunit I [Vibrio sp.]